ncbi:DUF4062 domain-containing protein [Actinomycetospora aeridis]|uniref:DUF4062 domain-containing protein n=1 Tax=Actinomycetospora aeridis TaxID=3129231 RepID=A0ABU8N3H0_9PSEU
MGGESVRVYLSSTALDLQEERRVVLEWLRGARHHAIDSYLPDSETVRTSCLADIAGCDLYVLVLGWRYGFRPADDNPENLAITHLEFREAGRLGIPRIALLQTHCPDVALSDLLDPERMPLVVAFRDEVRAAVRPAEFADALGLQRALSNGVQAELDKPRPAHDWVPEHAADLAARYATHLAGSALGSAPGVEYLDLLVAERAGNETEPDPPARPLAELVDGVDAPVILSGEGGAGKTTALLHLATECAARAVQDPTAPVPVYVDLARLTKLDDIPDLHRLIADSVSFAQDWAELTDLGILRDDRVVYLFDSLNELPDAVQLAATRVLGRFMAQKHGRRAIVASRPSLHLDKLPRDARRFEVLRLRPEQVQEFLEQLGLGTLYERMPDELRELAANPFMLAALSRTLAGAPSGAMPRNRGRLYEQFVQGWMRKEGHRRNAAYHPERVKQPVLSFLATRMTALARTSLVLDEDLEDELEERLEALQTRTRRRGGMPADWTVDACLDEIVDDGLLRREDDQLQFLHQSVQEYFTALHLRHDPVTLAELTPALHPEPGFSWGLLDPPAHRLVPVLLLVAGLVDDATPMVTALADRHPVLAAHVVAAANHIDRAVLAELTATWRDDLRREGFFPRAIACACLMQTGRASQVDIDAVVAMTTSSTSGNHVAEGALDRLHRPDDVARALLDRVVALDEHDLDASEFAIDELATRLPPSSLVPEIVRRLARTSDDGARVGLGRLLRRVAEPARSAAVDVLTQDDPALATAVRDLLEDPRTGTGLQRGVASLRAKIREVRGRGAERDATATAAIGGATDEDVTASVSSSEPVLRRAAIAEAVTRGLDVADALLDLICREDDPVGGPVAALVATIGPTAAVDALAARATAGDDVAPRVVRAISELDDPSATTALWAAMADGDPHVRGIAIAALAKRQAPGVVPRLLAALRGTLPPEVAGAALDAIEAAGSDPAAVELVDDLVLLAPHPDFVAAHPRWGSGPPWALAIHRVLVLADVDERVRLALRDALAGADPVARAAAVAEFRQWFVEQDLAEERLSAWRTSDVVARIVHLALHDESDLVRTNARRCVEALPSDDIGGPLLREMTDGDPRTRVTAADTLSSRRELGDALEVAARMMQAIVVGPDEEEELRREAAEVLARLPEGVEPVYRPIRHALGEGDPARALELADDVITALPRDVNLLWWRGHALLDLERPAEAAEGFERAADLDEDTAGVILQALAETRLDLDDVSGAVTAARRGAALAPDDPDAHGLLAWSCLRAGSDDECVAAATRALEHDPIHSGARWLLLLAEARRGNLPTAREALDRERRIHELLVKPPYVPFIHRALELIPAEDDETAQFLDEVRREALAVRPAAERS